MKINIYTASQESLANSGGSSIVESKIPLWWADGTSAGSGTNAGNNVAGYIFLHDGGSLSNVVDSSEHLFIINSNYAASQKYSFEATLLVSSSVIYCNVGIWDFTTTSLVSGSQINSNSISATTIRSGNFTLVPSHIYGITLWWSGSGGYTFSIVDASLIVFG
ncbi:hypothetical protein [Desulfosporosinus sp. FKA]|uniref:hypothetical protein n=1 Tax=Desulfosporosinus sp. FKA TaxID=1969834 RepID=UPI000B4991DF|nr:hypothetical protein [Desulfosporosinus sp. FKA]